MEIDVYSVLKEALKNTRYVPAAALQHSWGYNILLINLDTYTVEEIHLPAYPAEKLKDRLKKLISRLGGDPGVLDTHK